MAEPAGTIAVIGEALIDRFPDGDVIGGAPFNVARNLARLGAAPSMITRIGRDPLGAAIEVEFVRFGLDTAGLQIDDRHPTGSVAVRIEGTRHTFEIGADAAWDHLDTARTVAAVRAARPALVYVGTLAQRAEASRTAIRAALAATAAPVFLDLNLRDGPDNRALADASLTLAALLKVNDEELDCLTGWFGAAGSVPSAVTAWSAPAHRAAIEALATRFALDRVMVTRGGAGWAVFDAADGRWLEGAAPATTVRDTVGAGDAFAAVLLLGELRDWPLETTLERASAHASAVCGIQGAVDPSGALYARTLAAWAGVDPEPAAET